MIRFAVFAAVSTPKQAGKDKVSLDQQEKQCRAAALQRGWVESAGPFLVPGQSRTRWINLSDAARAIPALADLIASARRHEYDVLVIWDDTRLRDLRRPLGKLLRDEGIQTFSLAQPIEPVEPAHYDPSASDTAEIMEIAGEMASTSEGKHRNRRAREGRVARFERGLHHAVAPFGYRRQVSEDPKARLPAAIRAEQANFLITLKDMLLGGASLAQLEDYANTSSVPTTHGGPWRREAIRRMLCNPFYCGRVIYGRTYNHRDRYAGVVLHLLNDPERVQSVPGQHPPLWDEDTHRRILAEFRKRGRAYPGRRARHLSQLLRCGVCGATMWYSWYPRDGERVYFWRCSAALTNRLRGHVSVPEVTLLAEVERLILDELRRPYTAPAPVRDDRRASLQAELDELKQRRQRYADAFETGTLDARLFGDRTAELSARMAALRDDIAAAEAEAAQAGARQKMRRDLAGDLDAFQHALRHGEPQEVNNILRVLVETVVVDSEKPLQIQWK